MQNNVEHVSKHEWAILKALLAVIPNSERKQLNLTASNMGNLAFKSNIPYRIEEDGAFGTGFVEILGASQNLSSLLIEGVEDEGLHVQVRDVLLDDDALNRLNVLCNKVSRKWVFYPYRQGDECRKFDLRNEAGRRQIIFSVIVRYLLTFILKGVEGYTLLEVERRTKLIRVDDFIMLDLVSMWMTQDTQYKHGYANVQKLTIVFTAKEVRLTNCDCYSINQPYDRLTEHDYDRTIDVDGGDEYEISRN